MTKFMHIVVFIVTSVFPSRHRFDHSSMFSNKLDNQPSFTIPYTRLYLISHHEAAHYPWEFGVWLTQIKHFYHRQNSFINERVTEKFISTKSSFTFTTAFGSAAQLVAVASGWTYLSFVQLYSVLVKLLTNGD